MYFVNFCIPKGRKGKRKTTLATYIHNCSLFLHFPLFFHHQEAGLKELTRVYDEKDGLRQPLTCLVLLGYHLVLSYFIGNEEQYNMQLCHVSQVNSQHIYLTYILSS